MRLPLAKPHARRPPFFFVGEYPVDGNSPTLLFVSLVLASSGKRFLMPAHWSNTGDTVEGGAMRARKISLLVTTAEGESGNGSKGTSLNMMVISGVGFF
jgi:hypothetical protein